MMIYDVFLFACFLPVTHEATVPGSSLSLLFLFYADCRPALLTCSIHVVPTMGEKRDGGRGAKKKKNSRKKSADGSLRMVNKRHPEPSAKLSFCDPTAF